MSKVPKPAVDSKRLSPERIAELDAKTRELAAQLKFLQEQIQKAIDQTPGTNTGGGNKGR